MRRGSYTVYQHSQLAPVMRECGGRRGGAYLQQLIWARTSCRAGRTFWWGAGHWRSGRARPTSAVPPNLSLPVGLQKLLRHNICITSRYDMKTVRRTYTRAINRCIQWQLCTFIDTKIMSMFNVLVNFLVNSNQFSFCRQRFPLVLVVISKLYKLVQHNKRKW